MHVRYSVWLYISDVFSVVSILYFAMEMSVDKKKYNSKTQISPRRSKILIAIIISSGGPQALCSDYNYINIYIQYDP